VTPADPLTIIWFSPDSAGLTRIQTQFPSYAWTATSESLYEHHTQLTASPVVLFDLSGFKSCFAEQIHAIATILPQIPIIVVGSVADHHMVEQALDAGARDYYLGTLESPLLKHRIQQLMQNRSFGNAAGTTCEAPLCTGNHEPKTQQEIELAFMAFYDELTGLANRKLLFQRLEDQLKVNIPDSMCAPLLYIDLDGFKEINDTFTHKAGDWLLQQVSMRLRHCVKRSDTVSRVGGDEFCIILSDILPPSDIATIAQRILYNLSSPFFYNHNPIRISASIGIALYPQNALTSHELFNRADQAMYVAKQTGPGHYRFYSSEFSDIVVPSTVTTVNEGSTIPDRTASGA
jgi:diguanylate cyclase (GGDEF)-like protein